MSTVQRRLHSDLINSDRSSPGPGSKTKQGTMQHHGRILFLLPSLLLLGGFVVIPLGLGIGLAFFQWNGLGAATFVGFNNFITAISDPEFWHSAEITLWYVLGTTVGCNLLGLSLALALFTKFRGWKVFRTLFYLSGVMPIVATGITWGLIFNPGDGLLNAFLGAIGLRQFEGLWLASPHLALPLIIFVGIWIGVGLPMILFSAGLMRISPALLETAELDGASGVKRIWYVTLPLLKPVMIVTTLMLLISSIQVFATVWVMTGGGPGYATYVLGIYLYNTAFEYNRFGYANAMSVIIAVVAGLSMMVALKLGRVMEPS